MTRVATIPLQRTMSVAMQRAQEKLAITQAQLSTGKKATDFASLGTETVRNLSAHTMLAKQEAQANVAKRVETTLSFYQANIETIHSSASDLKQSLLTAVGTGSTTGLQSEIDAAFHQFRVSLNASEGGMPLFAGSQTDTSPFSATQLSDLAGVPAEDLFHDDNVRAGARVADNVDVTYGLTVSDVGKDLYTAFRSLAELGPVSDPMTDAQKEVLSRVVSEFETGLGSLQTVDAKNGRLQAQLDTLASRGEQRALLLEGVIEDNEDADLGQVAIDLAQQKTVLQASYSVFAQLTDLSLVNFIR